MKRNKKNVLISVGVLIVIGIFGGFFFYQSRINKEKELIQNNFFKDKESIAAVNDVISEQEQKSEELKKMIQNKNYTFDDPYVIVDPYGISPLTALIIFQTKEEVEIKVSINDIFVTTMEKSTIHAIPIYGLRSNYNNKVLLSYDDKEKEIMIDRSNIVNTYLDVKQTNEESTIGTEVYFLSGTVGANSIAFDGSGNEIWFLTEDYLLDIEFLDNGHLYLSNSHGSGIDESYDGFYEIDLLGKIHKNYSLENGYHHELVKLKDGSILVAGGAAKDQKYIGSYVYQIDPTDGHVISSFDIYDLFYEIDSEFADEMIGVNVQVNSIDYHEDSKEMILSLRGINSVISLDYDTKKIKWILGDPEFYSNAFQTYLLHITDGSRLPKGAHTAFLTSDGYLGLFNNDFDVLGFLDPDIANYQENYSSAVLYKMDGKNIETVWEYDGDKKYFNYEQGSFTYFSDKSKLINFGWTIDRGKFPNGTAIYNIFNTYARIIELNEEDEEVFHALAPFGIYRAYKHSLYEETTKNYLDYDFQLVNNNSFTELEKIPTSNLYERLNNAIPSPYDFTLTVNTISMDVIFNDDEVVDVYFVSEDLDTYLLNYKKSGEKTPSILNIRLDGNYAVYLDINGVMYNTNKILSFR